MSDLELEPDHLDDELAEDLPEEPVAAAPAAEPVEAAPAPAPVPAAAPVAAEAEAAKPKPAASTPTKPAARTPTKPAARSTPTQTPPKRTTGTPSKSPAKTSQDAGSILIDGRDKTIKDRVLPPGKLSKDQIEDRIRAKNRAAAHKAASEGLASGSTVFDRATKDKDGKEITPEKGPRPTKAPETLFFASARDDKIVVKSPSKYTKEEIEERIRARNRASAKAKAKASLASGETVFDRMSSPSKPKAAAE